MARLTAAEKRLLRYPPVESTWECRATSKRSGETTRCGEYNPGNAERCWRCSTPKSRRPKLVWPRYEAACKKAGIEPGDRWRDPADAVELAAAYRQREKAADKRRKGRT